MTTKNIIGIETKRRFKVVDTIDDLEKLANQEIKTPPTPKIIQPKTNYSNKIEYYEDGMPKLKLKESKKYVQINNAQEGINLFRIYACAGWNNFDVPIETKKLQTTQNFTYDDNFNIYSIKPSFQVYPFYEIQLKNEKIISYEQFCKTQKISNKKIKKINDFFELWK